MVGPISSGGGDINPDLSAKSGTGPFQSASYHGGLTVNSGGMDAKTLMIGALAIVAVVGIYLATKSKGRR